MPGTIKQPFARSSGFSWACFYLSSWLRANRCQRPTTSPSHGQFANPCRPSTLSMSQGNSSPFQQEDHPFKRTAYAAAPLWDSSTPLAVGGSATRKSNSMAKSSPPPHPCFKAIWNTRNLGDEKPPHHARRTPDRLAGQPCESDHGASIAAWLAVTPSNPITMLSFRGTHIAFLLATMNEFQRVMPFDGKAPR